MNSHVNSSIHQNPLDSARYKAFEQDPFKVLGVTGTQYVPINVGTADYGNRVSNTMA